MIIRVSNKALIFREGRVLLNKCARADGSGFYYDLPGGGQRPGEAAEDGLRDVYKRQIIIKLARKCQYIYVAS